MHVPEQDVLALLRMSEVLVEKADAAFDGSVCSRKSLHKAEQVRLLTRLAADSVARRGELAALKFGDLDGRVLHIERGVSGEEVGPTKTKRTRRLTLGRTTVELWRASEATWHRRANGVPFGEWVFSRDIDHQRRLTAGALGHWFAELCAEADLVGVSLHRLRHSVATFLAVSYTHLDVYKRQVLVGPFVRNGKMSAIQRILLRVAMARPLSLIHIFSHLVIRAYPRENQGQT